MGHSATSEQDVNGVSGSESLKLATSSSSVSDDSSVESEASSIVKPPEVKELPPRATRGRRLGAYVNTEEDQLFWEHETWEEEDDDDEWETEDEGHYKDKFDSDFLSEDSEEEATETAAGQQLDKELILEEKKHRKKFDYEKIAQRRKQRKELSTRVWSVFEMEKLNEKNSVQGGGMRKKGSQKFLTQADHLRIAKQTEETNKRILLQIADEIESRKARQGQQNVDNTAKSGGEVEAWVSWSSDRKIEYEEARKSEAQKLQEALEPVKERQLLFFLNLSQPKESKIPSLYSQVPPEPIKAPRCTVFPHLIARYRDPVNGLPYSNIEAFTKIRERAFESDLRRVQELCQNTLGNHLSNTVT